MDIDMPADFTVRPCREFSEAMEKTLGYNAVSFMKTKAELQPRGNGRGSWQQRNKGKE